MRRSLVLVCMAAWLALPAGSRADTAGLTQIGPPASLTAIAFAGDGTVYGTVDRPSFGPRPLASPVLWRSSDHGRTWSAIYRAPTRTTLVVLGASHDAAYVQESDVALPLRIEAATGRATALPLGTFAGIDAAGTAYGFTYDNHGAYTLNRCPRTASSCDALPLPTGFEPQFAVDPNSVGVLAVRLTAPLTGRFLLSSSDGGATWAPGAPILWNCTCPMAFAGPAARTLYVMNGSDLSVSHSAGLAFDTVHVPPNGMAGIIVGSQPSAYVSFAGGTGAGGTILRTNDEGASFETLSLNESFPVVDPTDPAHLFMLHGEGWEVQSWDSGQSKSDVVDSQFGVTNVDPNFAGGSGRLIYTSAPGAPPSIWHSDDMGATWSRTPIPAGASRSAFRISRTNPRIAYTPGGSGAMRTFDGGAHWEPLPDSREILGIRAGEPYHLFANTGRDLFESVDAGTTWSPAPASALCLLTAAGGGRIACEGSPTPLSSPPAFTLGLYDSPDSPGTYAVATGKLIGDLGSDWVLNSDLASTAGFGPQPPLAQAVGVWAAPGGSTFYGFDGTPSVTWVRRGSGRWWRLQAAGRRLDLVAPLDRTHALVRMTVTTTNPTSTFAVLALLDLARPAVEPPSVQARGNSVSCVVAWQTTDAETSAYAWLRDGIVIAGATSADLQLRAADRGHDLSCRATARTDFGSTTLPSSNVFRAPGARVVTRLRLSGSARIGKLLRCGATVQISWLRDGRGIKNRHARRYRVTAADEGHWLACQTKASDGTITRSVRLRVPRARGGRSSALKP